MTAFALTEKTLPSGLRAVLLPRAETQTVTFLVLIGVGSRYETPRQSGLSHFLEHMFFKGTETRSTAKEIAEAIDNVGGEFNAFTGEEYTGYYVKVAAEYLARGAEVVSDILLRPLFPPQEIERERGVIKEEIRMYTDMPMRHVHHLWQQALFGTHPLGRRIDGSEKTVSVLQRRDFLNYTKQHYHSRNAVVVVAGNIKTRKTEQLLDDLFRPLAKGPPTHPKAAPKKVPRHRFVHEYRSHLDQTHVMVGAPGLSVRDERRYAAALLAAILGSGMSSRLFLAIRERRGLAYMVRTSSDTYTDAGSFVTQAGVRTDKALLAIQLIMEEYDRVRREVVSDAELHKAKQMLRGQLVLQLEETNALAMFAGEQALLEDHIQTLPQILRKIDTVTVSDVQQVASDMLSPRHYGLALLSPHKSTRAFEKLVESA
jgi:predicted Zn-dependent peptidase